LSLLATITLEIFPFRVYAQFPALLPFFRSILEVGFYEGVLPQSPQIFQVGGLSVVSSIGDTKKSRVRKTVVVTKKYAFYF
jgi:hypothetical protein